MRFGYNETCLAHDPGDRHPESAERLRAVRAALEEVHGARVETARPASVAALESVHDPSYVGDIRRFCEAGGGRLDADTVASEGTWEAALASAGLSVWAASTAAGRHAGDEIPFALGRPPGHHALADVAMGFCIFNNAAVAAQTALDEGVAETVAIFDWDVHQGNGTQAIFEERSDVVYISIHEDELYPGTGRIEEIGLGDGAGATMNIPLARGATTASYLAAYDDAIGPWLRDHRPDLLLVCAGFDAHREDPIASMNLDTEGFGLLTERVLSTVANAEAALGFILEGGYALQPLTDGVVMVHEVCAGYEPAPAEDALRESDRERIAAVRAAHGLGS